MAEAFFGALAIVSIGIVIRIKYKKIKHILNGNDVDCLFKK